MTKYCLAETYQEPISTVGEPDLYEIKLYTIQGLLKKYPQLKFAGCGTLCFVPSRLPKGVKSALRDIPPAALHCLGNKVEVHRYGLDWEDSEDTEIEIPSWAVKSAILKKETAPPLPPQPPYEVLKIASLSGSYSDVKVFEDGSMKIGCENVNIKGSKDLFKKLAEVHGYELD